MCHAIALHGDSVEGVGNVHGVLLVRDDDQLAVLAQIREHREQAHEVALVQGGLHLEYSVAVDEAIEKANNTAYGLSAGVWTDKGSRILKMSTELKAGVVWANTFNKFDPTSPFGGYKESGFGREGGRQGLLDYCKLV